ncbi:MAG: hypothetical protein WCW87_01655 [Candidatus Paceibacterota bacterium]
MSAINVTVKKNPNENNTSILRRFTKRVQESGVLKKVRSVRYSKRKESSYVKKKKKLKGLKHREEITQLIKLGKMVEKTNQHQHQSR